MKRIWIALAASFLTLSACRSVDKWHNVPLAEGDVPYVLPPGTYVDADGVEHVEANSRWSMSEADVFRYIMFLKQDAKSGK